MALSLSAFNYVRTTDLDPCVFACTTDGPKEIITTFPYEIGVLSGCTLELSTPCYTDTVDLSAAIAYCLSIGTTVQDSNCIDMSIVGSGTAQDPFILSADPILAPDPLSSINALSCTPAGLLVDACLIFDYGLTLPLDCSTLSSLA